MLAANLVEPIYDFERLVHDYKLEEPPSTERIAYLSWVVLFPTPSEVYSFIDNKLCYWQEEFIDVLEDCETASIVLPKKNVLPPEPDSDLLSWYNPLKHTNYTIPTNVKEQDQIVYIIVAPMLLGKTTAAKRFAIVEQDMIWSNKVGLTESENKGRIATINAALKSGDWQSHSIWRRTHLPRIFMRWRNKYYNKKNLQASNIILVNSVGDYCDLVDFYNKYEWFTLRPVLHSIHNWDSLDTVLPLSIFRDKPEIIPVNVMDTMQYSNAARYHTHSSSSSFIEFLFNILEKQPLQYATLDRIFARPSGKPGQKILLTADDVYNLCIKSVASPRTTHLRKVKQWLINNRPPISNVSVANILATVACAPDTYFYRILEQFPKILQLRFTDFAKCMKILHTGIKQTRTLPIRHTQLSKLEALNMYGLDLIPGRSELYKYSAYADIIMRMVQGPIQGIPRFTQHDQLLWDQPAWRALFREKLHEVVREAMVTAPRYDSFSDFWKRRLGWASGGSAPGVKVQLAGFDDIVRANKRAALTAMDEQMVRSLMYEPEEAILHSRNAVKYELGKSRPLWNAGTEHYVLSSYIMESFENNVSATLEEYSSGHHAAQRVYHDIQRLHGLESGVGLMWDYTDFNINHSLWAQSELVHAVVINSLHKWGHLYSDETQKDMRRVGEWVYNSYLNTYMEDVESGLFTSVVRTLLTGVRGTAFGNTFLNMTYMRMVNYEFERTVSPNVRLTCNYEQGDDVFGIVPNVPTGVLYCGFMNLMGFAGALHKIMLDYTPRGEYLRRAYIIEQDSIRVTGYPLRSMYGCISGEYFGVSVMDPVQRSAALLEQLQKTIRRGARMDEDAWYEKLCQVNASMVYTDQTGYKHRIYPEKSFVITPSYYGGAGVTGKEVVLVGKPRLYHNVRKMPSFELPASILTHRTFDQSSISDYRAMFRDVGSSLSDIEAEARRAIVNSAFQGTMPREFVTKLLDPYVKDWFLWQRSLQSKPIIDIPQIVLTSAEKNAVLNMITGIFTEGQAPTHHYHMMLGIASGLGYTLWEIMQNVVNLLRKRHAGNELLAWIDIINHSRDTARRSNNPVTISHTLSICTQLRGLLYTWLCDGLAPEHSMYKLRFDYLKGDIQFMPVVSNTKGLGTEFLSLSRDIALVIVEPLILYGEVSTADVIWRVHTLEQYALQSMHVQLVNLFQRDVTMLD